MRNRNGGFRRRRLRPFRPVLQCKAGSQLPSLRIRLPTGWRHAWQAMLHAPERV